MTLPSQIRSLLTFGSTIVTNTRMYLRPKGIEGLVEIERKTTLVKQVERSSRLGRHLVATVDIPAGTMILNELPMVVGPRQLTKPVCLGCHKELTQGKEIKLETQGGAQHIVIRPRQVVYTPVANSGKTFNKICSATKQNTRGKFS